MRNSIASAYLGISVTRLIYTCIYKELVHGPLPAGDTKTGAAGIFDSAVQAIGRAAFFPQFALFPVKYLDSDMAVFTFPPLRDSLIAVRKVS